VMEVMSGSPCWLSSQDEREGGNPTGVLIFL
jgi:hypothetical protein